MRSVAANSLCAALALAAMGFVPTKSHAQYHVIHQPARPTYLSVVSGTSAEVEGTTLILKGIPALVYFSDRPVRLAGHRPTADFLEIWDKYFVGSPDNLPNATLSTFSADSVSNTVIEITGVALVGSDLRFEFKILDGELTDGSLGPTSLFIDGVK